MKLFVTLSIILAGLGGRSAVDKALALRGGPELVALWAQLGSVIELIAGVAMAGVGTGLSVLVAQAAPGAHQRRLLRAALRAGLSVSVPAMIVVAALAVFRPRAVIDSGLSPALLVFGALVGCVAVAPAMLNSYWLGQQRRGAMLALALGSAAISLGAALVAPPRSILQALALAQAAPVLLTAVVLGREPARRASAAEARHAARQLLRYMPAGVAIGILSPGSMLAARSIVSGALSWHAAGELQALWRVSDWVGSLAAGVLSVYFLPRLSASAGTPRFALELRRAALATLLPSAAAFAMLLVWQRPVFSLLYDPSVELPDRTVALFFAGSLARIVAWVPLFALYATRRTLAIAAGEFLSLPLFAALLGVFASGLTLERAAAMWLTSYLAYGAFNLWALRRGG